MLECEGVWDIVGVRRFGELVEQSCSSSALGSGVWGRQRREECGCSKIPARGVVMQVMESKSVGWDGVGVGVGLLCWLFHVRCLCSSLSLSFLVFTFISLIRFNFTV